MKTLNKQIAVFALALLALIAIAPPAHGQGSLRTTTLSAAVAGDPSSNITCFNVASATGIVAPSFGSPNSATGNQTMLYVDTEAMFVTAVNGTYVCANRGYAGTVAKGHTSGAVVYVGSPAQFGSSDKSPGSACTATNEFVLPFINVITGHFYQCATTGGRWYQFAKGTMNGSSLARISNFCTGTAGSAETDFLNGAACSGATTATARQVISEYGVIANLRVFSSAAFLGTGGSIVHVLKNGTNTTITCSPVATATVCSDLTHSVTVAPGDVITFSFLSATSDTAANISANVDLF